jgi:hypothetical protein
VESPQRDGVCLIAASLFVRDVPAATAWWSAAARNDDEVALG